MSVKHNELRILYLLNSRDELYANSLLTTIETELRCYRSSFEVIVGERCAAKEQWRFQCDDGRRTAIKTALNTKIEDGSHLPEEDGKFGKYILLS
ncbi:hypothetical protein T4E_10417 [Trichinella pseudospiralis]|uniref:Uncharacterized protein n=1 Tax=Trichinella pseudospiralis TaxID=6337 RepID=A0A0V0XD21_TRIPS|nr:hypothetical protein T4E_10417 [Trichinella pseudospiralis]